MSKLTLVENEIKNVKSHIGWGRDCTKMLAASPPISCNFFNYLNLFQPTFFPEDFSILHIILLLDTNPWPDAREAPVGAVIPKSRNARKSSNFTYLTVSSQFQRLVEARRMLKYIIPRDSKHLQVCGQWNHVCARKVGGRQRVHEQRRSSAHRAETKRATSAHRTGIEHGTTGNERTGSGHQARKGRSAQVAGKAHEQRPSSTRATAIERVWSGYRGHGEGRGVSAYGAGVVGTGGGRGGAGAAGNEHVGAGWWVTSAWGGDSERVADSERVGGGKRAHEEWIASPWAAGQEHRFSTLWLETDIISQAGVSGGTSLPGGALGKPNTCGSVLITPIVAEELRASGELSALLILGVLAETSFLNRGQPPGEMVFPFFQVYSFENY
ncbi:hypothetical protein B0H14DRAFT_3761333 [Mycena olivaceomarginata]|nr:hypothetical protein B0H14DRAFT_3761333 [Mycena olivaceomarginata]